MDEQVGTLNAGSDAPGLASGSGEATADVDPDALPRRTGLSAAEVSERIAAGQVNDVPVRSSRSVGEIVRGNLFTRINAIMAVLFVIIMAVGPIQDGLFGGVILANTLIGIFQEIRAKRTLDQLAIVGETKPTVWRDGERTTVSPAEIVLDELVDLAAGDKIVVDGTVVASDSLEVDESLLTGEADPVLKQPGDSVMSGSFVVAGAGTFTATRVGREAYAAQLAEEARRFTLVNSELRSGINRILKFVTYAIVPAGIALILTQLTVSGQDLPEAVRRMVGGLVPMVPEGLVLLTSLAFAIGVIRLGKQRCLVQELPAIEGLARVDTVCLDKTGTLTEASMDVQEVRPAGPEVPDESTYQVLGLLGGADERPNPSMAAIIRECPPPDERSGWLLGERAPFSSARKWSGAVCVEPSGRESVWLLGAPEMLLPPEHPTLQIADEYGERGLRVLLLVRCAGGELTELLAEPTTVERLATPVALVVLRQRIRPEAPGTLRYFAEQQVATKVISGDNAVSVGAVAEGLNLPGADHPVDARTLPAQRESLAESIEHNAIFGRVGPQQKQEMVGALQSRGHTVAMTGDGVNDVLALKDADIGVAMGSGSPATRAVAQIVLLNNSFSALPSVVAEGRRVIGNIERVANLFLTKTAYSVLLALVVVLAQVPYPFLPRHITLIGSLTIGVPAFFLALAPNSERARPRFVDRVLRFAVPAGSLSAAATAVSYLFARHVYADNLAAETSVATLALFLTALWVLAIVARPYTWWRILLVGTMGAGFGLVLTVPFLQDFFQVELVGSTAPLVAVVSAATAGILLEVWWAASKRRFVRREAAEAGRVESSGVS